MSTKVIYICDGCGARLEPPDGFHPVAIAKWCENQTWVVRTDVVSGKKEHWCQTCKVVTQKKEKE